MHSANIKWREKTARENIPSVEMVGKHFVIQLTAKKVCVLANSGFPNVPHDLSLTTWERSVFQHPPPFHPLRSQQEFSLCCHALCASPRWCGFLCRREISSHASFIGHGEWRWREFEHGGSIEMDAWNRPSTGAIIRLIMDDVTARRRCGHKEATCRNSLKLHKCVNILRVRFTVHSNSLSEGNLRWALWPKHQNRELLQTTKGNS